MADSNELTKSKLASRAVRLAEKCLANIKLRLPSVGSAHEIAEWQRAVNDAAELRRIVGKFEGADRRSEYWKASHLAGNAEIDRLRGALQKIADHHEAQRAAWADESGDADNASYHEVRRNFAMSHLTDDDR